MKKAAVVLFILIALFQAAGGFAVGKSVVKNQASIEAAYQKRLAQAEM